MKIVSVRGQTLYIRLFLECYLVFSSQMVFKKADLQGLPPDGYNLHYHC